MGGPARLVIDAASELATPIEALWQTLSTRLNDIERRYSRYLDNSLVSMINRRAGTQTFTEIDTETTALFDLAGQLWRESEGLFDLTSGPLRRAFNFQNSGAASPEYLEAALTLIGWGRIEWRENALRLPVAGMEIDLGGLVKEYAADCAAQLMRAAGVKHGLIELAGDLVAIGTQASGAPWSVGIRDPQQEGSILAVHLTDSAMATSGNYARVIKHEGQTYGHLLDPRSGLPVEGPTSVTVIDNRCLTAGAVSTVACLKTNGDAEQWLNQAGLPWLIINTDNTMSGPIADAAPADTCER